MSKSLIVTFHCVPNYGAALQVFALQKTLMKFSNSVNILDYRQKVLTDSNKLVSTRTIKGMILSLYNIIPNWKRHSKFKRFESLYFELSSEMFVDSAKVLSKDCDYVFVGSDQIWNPQITGGYDEIYFGDFSTKENCKRISYAASIGISSLNKRESAQLKILIEKIDSISVRENNARQLLSDLTDKSIEVVLDPTLLLERKEWDSIKITEEYGEYLLLYSLSDYDETREIANRVSKITGFKIIEISTKNRKPFEAKAHKTIYTAGPSEFLGLVSGAEFVVTDSFHGTVFSLMYHKPFYTIPNKTKGSRMIELLDKIGLRDRLISDIKDFSYNPEIEYIKVDEILKVEKQKSMTFITKAMDIDNEQN